MTPSSFETACHTHLHTTQHLEAHPEAEALLAEAIGKIVIDPGSAFLLKEVDMGRVIGRSGVVDAPIVKVTTFACRKGRDVPSRVRTDVEKPETTLFTVIAGFDNEAGRWELYAGFAGPSAPKEPTDPSLKDGNAHELEFWSSHALVWDEGWDEPFVSTWATELEKVAAKRAAQG